MFSFETLEITGFRDHPVPHTYLRQADETSHLAIVLPGVGYTTHMPLLYYPTQLLLNMGADILRIETAYVKREDYDELPPAQQARWVFTDATAACRVALAQRDFDRVTLVGKSLGTLAMGYLITAEEELEQAQAVWLTPLLWNDMLRAQIQRAKPRSFFAVGTADSHYNAGYLSEVQAATENETVVIEGANHSLEIEGDVRQSVSVLERLVEALQAFLVGV